MFLRKYYRRKFFFILFSLLFVGFAGGVIFNEIILRKSVNITNVAQAELYVADTGDGDAVDGFAWTPTFGWISFNSSDCDRNGASAAAGYYIGDIVPSGPNPWRCPPLTDPVTPFFDYGVDIDAETGTFEGYAWSSNLGWIYFGPDADLGASYGDILAADMPEEPRQWPIYDSTDHQVRGWAKILAWGDNGWIKFNHGRENEVSIDPLTSKMKGYAWNGNADGTGAGWISFSCENYTTCSSPGHSDNGLACNSTNCSSGECCELGVCENTCEEYSTHQVYAQISRPPRIISLEAPFLSHQDLCEMGVRRAVLKWEFRDPDVGDEEGAYQVIFDDDADPDNDTPLLNTGKCDISSNSPGCLIAPGVSRYPVHEIVSLKYGQRYYWWVTVWDRHGVKSEQESSAEHHADFSIPGHEWPTASIDDFKPSLPSAGEEIRFWGSSNVYNFTNPAAPINCTNDRINCPWLWSASPAYYTTINDSATTSPIMIFNNSQQEFAVYLSVTDKDGNTCTSTPVLINPKMDLPYWIEVKN